VQRNACDGKNEIAPVTPGTSPFRIRGVVHGRAVDQIAWS
jgi:hypothetical protein